ncbi:MAG: cytochrome c [Bradyrhizobium sp.]|nr:cytochrome c [Bradyrhizobium sp.]
MKRSVLVLSATTVLLWSTFGYARTGEQRQGKEMLQKLCASCHSIGRTGASPNKLAPPFRSFSETKLYDSDLKQRLLTGLTSIHPIMPTFRFSREDAEEVLSYMRSIQEPRKPK